jgi:predicted ATPase/signal transduction histidine kinase
MSITISEIPGYQITEKLHDSSRTLVYRAIQVNNSQPVVIKLLRQEYPTFSELVQFRNQYTITRNLNIPTIIKPYSLQSYKNGYALVMEDFGGISLAKYIQTQPLNIAQFLPIAILIANTLHQLHQQRVIHKDIKPANILINPTTQEVKLIDFSIASLLPRETQEIQNPNVIEGTLAYISPEQTGRMNRGIDYRSDFYSLGVTFFELLTGEIPFVSDDIMELIHCHIAKIPPTLHSINPEMPPVLSEIVAKLMAKNAEERYQSALGLEYDLEICLRQLEETGEIANFLLGQRDARDRFLIPEKLYGRELEVKMLLEGFDRVAKGKSELMLVAGFSGIGKTAVVNEVHKPIVRQRGYFIKGKFDQFNRNIPFSAFVQAFRNLIGQLWSENDTELQQWRTKILQGLGENAQVIIEVIPELEKIIGKQPPVTELTGSSAQNRFNLLFSKFLQIFTTKEHPLVIFLDDLQWADLASLKLIKMLMSEGEIRYLFLIGAYRDNEVSPVHPLIQTVDEMQRAGGKIQTITLSPLKNTDVNQLITDTLNCQPELAQPLTDLVYMKTKGNPFFTTQLLKSLYEDGLIAFKPPSVPSLKGRSEGGWECDITRVRTLTLTDDVVVFMALQLQKLATETQNVLKLAACIGNQFDLETLAIVYQKSVTETASDLWKALQEGLILPQSEVYKFFLSQEQELVGGEQVPSRNEVLTTNQQVNYRFLHDHVQQAAYALIPEDSKKLTHVNIGQLLLNNTEKIEDEDKIFDIVNHLNQGIDLIVQETEKNQLAQLNLVAGRKAKASTAYGAAVEYLNLGLQLLAVDSWEHQYDLTLKLHIEAIEAEYLNTNFEDATALAMLVLPRANSLLERVRVYELQMQIYVAKLELLKTIEIGIQVLKMLEISLEKPIPVNLVIEDLATLPEMTEPQKMAAMRILMTLIAAAYFADPALLFPIILTMIHLSCKYGNCSYSAYGYVLYGLLLCGPLADIESGYRYGQLALQLLNHFNAKELRAKIFLVYNGNIRHWKEHTKTTIKPLLEAIQVGVETGDIEYAGYASTNYCDQRFAIGESLDLMEQQRRQYIDLMQKFQQEYSINYQKMGLQMTLNLLGKAEDKCQLIGPDFDETKMLPIFWERKTATLLFYFHWLKGRLLYLFESVPEAVSLLKIAEEYIGSVAGMVTVGEHNFYYSLALLAWLNSFDLEGENEGDRANYLAQVISNQKKLKEWANLAPSNFQHKYDLVEAEQAKLLKENWQATEFYDRAISLAKENGYTQEEALANELAAKFYLDRGKEKFAQSYMIEAYYCYSRWGAKAKIADLEKRYPQLLIPILQQKNREITNPVTISATGTLTSSSSAQNILLDFVSVMKAAQAISSEIELEKLLATLMQIVIANAGAQTGSLILHQEEQWLVLARANQEQTEVLEMPLEQCQDLPQSLIYSVARSQELGVFDNLSSGNQFAGDRYIITHQPKSVLCTPISKQGEVIGILYLENNLTEGAFTRDRVETLQLLTAQAAISLENARLYQQIDNYSHNLEAEVARKTEDLNQKAQDLEQTLKNLQSTQAQLIQSEKMSSLGQLVSGIAHEINNPVTFIIGNLSHAENHVKNLLSLLTLYQQEYPEPSGVIQAKIEEIELEFIWEDLTKVLQSMKAGSDRISQIILSLRNFSRLDESDMKAVDLHQGIDSTLLFLQKRFKGSGNQREVKVIKDYGNLPNVTCYASQLNQVFLSLITNAIDALEDSSKLVKNPQIMIRTEVRENNQVRISISDNGVGIPPHIQERIFDPFFTTKPVGKGTGLGLAVSYAIVKKHHGKLTCHSTVGEGTEFHIEIPIQ